ncbi:MAG: copper homeostasis periplasmic binding protein CopC [Phenylobacterium sp.]|nr:MAG: copper homeostasis periplasmic binding protein CopC [Phenylobacterium sp.]
MRHILTIAAAVAALAAAGQAQAHARLLHAAPAVGSTAHGSPQALRLSFSETIEPAKSNVAITGPTGPVSTGPLALDAKDKRVVVIAPSAPLRPGAYKVSWGMTSADGHHTDGTYVFKVAP